MFLVIDVARIIVNVGWFSMLIIVFVILYRLYLKKIKSTQVNPNDFVELSPIEKVPAKGEIQFYFTMKHPQKVTLKMYSQKGDFREILCDEEKKTGSHVISYDTTQLIDGWYFYELITPKQKSTKMMEVKNLS